MDAKSIAIYHPGVSQAAEFLYAPDLSDLDCPAVYRRTASHLFQLDMGLILLTRHLWGSFLFIIAYG